MSNGAPSEKALVEFFVAQKTDAREQRKEIEEYWKRTEVQMLNKHDFSKKKDWQAKLFYSMTSPTVNRASRMIKNMLMKSEDYFEMDYIGREDFPLAKAFKPAIKFYLNDAQFPERFAESAASGFNYSIGIQKMFCRLQSKTVIVDDQRVTRDVMKLHINTLNPWNCYWPRDWAYFIEDTWTTLPELLRKAESGIYDNEKGDGSGLKKIKKIIGTDYRLEKPGGDAADQEQERLSRIGIQIENFTNDYRKPVLLSEYWGPVIDKKGNITLENQKFVIVNEKYVLQMPIDNPFAHQKWPYIFIVPLKVLFRHFGEGLTWGVEPVQREMNNILNLMSDSLKFQMLGINQVSEDMLVDRNKPLEIFPGKFVRIKGDPRREAFRHIPMGADPDAAAGFMHLLRTIYQNHTGMTEYLMGAPTLKGSPTATEVATKTAEGQGDFQSIAEDIDRQGIVGACEMAKDLIIQYFADVGVYPSVTRIFADETGRIIQELSPEEKIELLLGDWDIRARGISLFFERQEQINKLARYTDFLAKAIPPEISMTNVNWKEIGEAWSEAVWGDKDKFWKWQEEQPQMQQVYPTEMSGEAVPPELEQGINQPKLPYGTMQ